MSRAQTLPAGLQLALEAGRNVPAAAWVALASPASEAPPRPSRHGTPSLENPTSPPSARRKHKHSTHTWCPARRLVSEAQSREAPVQRLADWVAGKFCYSVMAASAATFAFWSTLGGWCSPEQLSFCLFLLFGNRHLCLLVHAGWVVLLLAPLPDSCSAFWSTPGAGAISCSFLVSLAAGSAVLPLVGSAMCRLHPSCAAPAALGACQQHMRPSITTHPTHHPPAPPHWTRCRQQLVPRGGPGRGAGRCGR